MGEMTGRLELRLPPDTLKRIERWQRKQSAPPTKAAAIRYIMELGLAEAEKQAGLARAGAATPSGGTGSGGAKKPAASKAATPGTRKAGQERKAAPTTPTSKEAQLRALREQGAR